MKLFNCKIARMGMVPALLGTVVTARAGDLDPPPGPVMPTMKTLTEVEPRVPVQSLAGSGTALHVINEPGSYYLTANITGVADKAGIDIAASGITVDLSGFDLVGVPGSQWGILVTGTQTNIVIQTGSIRKWGQGIGGANAESSVARGLVLDQNGSEGIQFGPGALIESCTARANAGVGFRSAEGSMVVDCTSNRNGVGIEVGQGSVVADCSVSSNSTGNGISAGAGSVVRSCSTLNNAGNGIVVLDQSEVINCVSLGDQGIGIQAGNSSTVQGCTVNASGGDGIQVISVCRVAQNRCNGTGGGLGVGIHVTGRDCRIAENNVGGYQFAGIQVDQERNLIVRNFVSSGPGGPAGYVIAPGNQVGPITNDPTSAGPWANFSNFTGP